jgi:CRP-like cAMP-binding protein
MPARPTAPANLELLRESHLFDGVADSVVTRIAEAVPAEVAQPGEIVIAEGELAAHMFVVLSGEVEVLHKGDADHDVRLALLGPGDWIGEMAILDVLQPRSASVRALAPTTLLRLSGPDTRRLIQEPEPLQYALLVANIARELARRLRVADRIIANASSHIVQRYVAESRRPPAG